MRAEVCPKCHQPVRHNRAGVYLGPVKLLIFDILHAAGDVGLSREEIGYRLAWDGKAGNLNTVKAHIYQMNELLAGTDYQIGRDRHRPARYLLVRRGRNAA